MGTVRCRLTLELHDQVLLHTETVRGVVTKTYMVNSMIKDVNTPISVLYRTESVPYTDGTVLVVQADADIARGTVRANVYEHEVQPPELAVVVPAPYTTPPRLFFDAVVLREIHSDTWSGRVGVFEIEVAVDFGDKKDITTQLDARCSLPRHKKAYKKLTELFTTQSVRICGDVTGWVHASMIWVEVNSLEPLNKPPPSVGRKLDLTGRARRSASPVKGVGRDGRRGRAHSPVKGLSPVRASSPVKELSSSFDTFSIGRSTSPVKDFKPMGPPESPASNPAIFAQQRAESGDLMLGSLPVSPEPVKSIEIKPILVAGRTLNCVLSQEPTGTLSQNLGMGTPPADLLNDIFSKFAVEDAGIGAGCETDGLTPAERSGLELMKSWQQSLTTEGVSSNMNPVGKELGAASLNDPQALVPSLAVNPGADVTLDANMVEEFLKNLSGFDTNPTDTGVPVNPQGDSEKGVGGWEGSYELPPPSPGVWSF